MDYLFWILLGYFSGSVLYAYWIPKWFYHMDIRKVSDDGNPGTFNVFQHCGIRAGILVLLLDMGKAFLPIHMAMQGLDQKEWAFALVLAAPVIGHAFPLWHHLKGGKSIASSFGAMLGIYPNLVPAFLLAVCYIIFSVIVVINPHLFRSVVTFLVWNMGCWRIYGSGALTLGCFLISVVVIAKHLGKFQGEKFSLELFHLERR